MFYLNINFTVFFFLLCKLYAISYFGVRGGEYLDIIIEVEIYGLCWVVLVRVKNKE